MRKKALLLWGGWAGHQPEQMATLVAGLLQTEGFDTVVAPTLDVLLDADVMQDVSVMYVTHSMSQITDAQLDALLSAVRGGIGLAGNHGGLCDAFRDRPEYLFMTGGQFVAHPGGLTTRYDVHIVDQDHFITADSADFVITSEQYYLLVDPANHVLATTHFPTADGPHVPNGPVAMPLAWTKQYGAGRVFYCSIGHEPANLQQPDVQRLCARGILWAAKADTQNA